jgi:hypothetical protein
MAAEATAISIRRFLTKTLLRGRLAKVNITIKITSSKGFLFIENSFQKKEEKSFFLTRRFFRSKNFSDLYLILNEPQRLDLLLSLTKEKPSFVRNRTLT